jgi:hypothetical protein
MTEVNQELENRLWSLSDENPLDEEAGNKIIDYLLARLSDYLQTPLKLVDDNWFENNSFSSDFKGKLQAKAFHISFAGTMGMQILTENNPHVSAWLFLFGDHFRLAAGQSDRSYIYLDYNKKEGHLGEWESFGWQIDEFDEYESIIEGEIIQKI